jgi:hypothetical protein
VGFGDQAFFNHLLAKLERVHSWLLTGAQALVATAEGAIQCGGCPFVQFPFSTSTWLERGDEKSRQMSPYMKLSRILSRRSVKRASQLQA